MKILSSAQIRLADQFTILNEPISSLDLMERAANCCFSWIVKKYPQSCFHVVAGKGNNGGDGLVIARKLLESGFKVRTSLIQHSTKGSIEYETNLKRLKQQKASLKLLELGNKLVVHNDEVLIDALFGSGLTRPIASNSDLGLLIHQMNKCNETVAIDIPSGLFADDNSDNLGAIIRAKYTLTFQAPKLAFMHDSSHQFVGEFAVLNIGLHPQYLQEAKTNYHFVSREISALELKPVIKTAHKGTNGRALLIAGTKGKMGAAILASKAALRVGVGLLSVKVPEFGLNLIQGTVPEAMAIGDSNEKYNTELPNLLGFDAIGIGPGIDTSVACEQLISELIQTYSKPMVIDADALNLLSKRKDLWSKLPHGSILTPHLGEFQRLFGSISSPEEAMKIQAQFCKKHQCVMILKGAHTRVCDQQGVFYFNSTGNSGMAKGGSGDVLTGILTSLLAQGYSPIRSAILGVYIHGLAGDIAAETIGLDGMIAGDLITCLPNAMKALRGLSRV